MSHSCGTRRQVRFPAFGLSVNWIVQQMFNRYRELLDVDFVCKKAAFEARKNGSIATNVELIQRLAARFLKIVKWHRGGSYKLETHNDLRFAVETLSGALLLNIYAKGRKNVNAG